MNIDEWSWTHTNLWSRVHELWTDEYTTFPDPNERSIDMVISDISLLEYINRLLNEYIGFGTEFFGRILSPR